MERSVVKCRMTRLWSRLSSGINCKTNNAVFGSARMEAPRWRFARAEDEQTLVKSATKSRAVSRNQSSGRPNQMRFVRRPFRLFGGTISEVAAITDCFSRLYGRLPLRSIERAQQI